MCRGVRVRGQHAGVASLFCHVASWDQTQVDRCGSECPCLLSHVLDPRVSLSSPFPSLPPLSFILNPIFPKKIKIKRKIISLSAFGEKNVMRKQSRERVELGLECFSCLPMEIN